MGITRITFVVSAELPGTQARLDDQSDAMISAGYHQRLCRARRRLLAAGGTGWPLARIAAEAGLSRYQFIRRFAAVFGETPHQYRQRHRLERARDMLLLGDEPVTEVCLAVGFSSLGSFSSLFKRRYGIAPSRFRQRARADRALNHLPGCMTLLQQAWNAHGNFREAQPPSGQDNDLQRMISK